MNIPVSSNLAAVTFSSVVLDYSLVPAAAVPEAKPEATAATLGVFVDSYISGRANLKPNTARNYDQTRKYLLAYFGSNKPLSDITQGDADAWRESMIGKGLSAATVSREVKRARQFFRAAVRKRLLVENPFDDLPSPQQVNRARDFFVTREMTAKVLGACPDAEWRLLVALARFGGVRTPSESLALQWADVDWGGQRKTPDALSSRRPHYEMRRHEFRMVDGPVFWRGNMMKASSWPT
jgi:integrase